MKDKLLVSNFSGGRTSAFLSRYIQISEQYNEYDKIFIYANTGKEREETLKFIQDCSERWDMPIVWVQAKINPIKGKPTTYEIVDYFTADRKGKVFEDSLKKFGLPNVFGSSCTRDLKLYPINKYVKSLGYNNITQAIGIRYDERHRKSNTAHEQNLIYPLCDHLKVDSKFIRSWWDSQEFDLELKDYEGNCDLCFKKSIRKKLTIIKECPDRVKWWDQMEKKYSNDQVPRFDLRNHKTYEDLNDLSKIPFRKVEDLQDLSKRQLSLFGVDIDHEYDCMCKSN